MAANHGCRCCSSSFMFKPCSSRRSRYSNSLLATVPSTHCALFVHIGTFPRFSSIWNTKSPRCLRFNNFNPAIAAAFAGKAAVESKPIRLTYLEGNSWLWDLGGVSILVDPVLVGNLDFGIPQLFEGAKKVLKNFRLEDLPELDCLLITQGLDDHCHIKTLRPLSQMRPDMQIVAARSAEPILSTLFKNVMYIEPGQVFEFEGRSGAKIYIRATAGPILGPPWQQPENGYKAIASFTLVSGQEDAVSLTKLLKAKYVIVMNNGDLDAKGFLAFLLRQDGTVDSFKQLLSRELPGVQVLEPTPGKPLEIFN